MAALTTVVVTWMDGAVATYKDITHSSRDGWLIIYEDDHGAPVVKWRFTLSNIRAVGNAIWQPDSIIHYAADGQVQHDAP